MGFIWLSFIMIRCLEDVWFMDILVAFSAGRYEYTKFKGMSAKGGGTIEYITKVVEDK